MSIHIEESRYTSAALEKSMNRDHTDELLKDLAEARKKKKKRGDSSKTPPDSPPHQPPPPPLLAGIGTLESPRAFGSSQVLPPPPSTNQEDRSATPELAWSIPSSDLPVPKNNWASALASTYSPPSEDSLLAQTDEGGLLSGCWLRANGARSDVDYRGVQV
nr:hypothetical protein [Tanacetum cinerariifolium]